MYAFLFCSRLSMLSQTKPLPLLLHTHNYALYCVYYMLILRMYIQKQYVLTCICSV